MSLNESQSSQSSDIVEEIKTGFFQNKSEKLSFLLEKDIKFVKSTGSGIGYNERKSKRTTSQLNEDCDWMETFAKKPKRSLNVDLYYLTRIWDAFPQYDIEFMIFTILNR